ncbi:C_GCAxxG_C_C family protein [Desulforamulus reducens MI-1]|uniref:C_GCAxxG_C_C family protein n=1 Tax=Desulforamulus reducens (strain ATCC BAA-1160 / DSM 100696 / MI-1) TaxID=349161 RepID=A4J777_DESRM|nr:C-GCAxxG-C-C family protein [Desulforamulus reducens]ABO50930.1 C_GCAxxG_C_C family protein [Desulforamulus reducens MI-1]
MSDNIATQARNKAGGYYKEGYNCAEAIFLAFREYLAPELSPELVKLITGFGSGVGHAGCLCGALSGSVMALNMVKGRTSNQEKRDAAYDTVRQFHDRFREQFGSTDCRVLNPHPHDTPEQLKNCLKITGGTAKLLMEFLQEKSLYKMAE